METETDFFQFGQMSTVEKVEDIDEHVIADQKGDFHFLSLHTDIKYLLLLLLLLLFIYKFAFNVKQLILANKK